MPNKKLETASPVLSIIFYENGYMEKALVEKGKGSKLRLGTLAPCSKNDLIALLSSVQLKAFNIMQPSLIPVNILRIGWNTDGLDITWEVEAQIRKINFSKDNNCQSGEYYIPRCIFRYMNGDLHVACVKSGKEKITNKTILWKMPLPNMLTETESCMGTAVPKQENITNIKELIEHWTDSFFSGEFTHSVDEKIKTHFITNPKSWTLEKLLKKLDVKFQEFAER